MQRESNATQRLNRPAGTPDGLVQVLRASNWQMSYGERAALEGLLCQSQPELAIEIGTAEGGSLARIAAHSAEVHSFDLVEPDPDVKELSNVTFHAGDSHVLLPRLLARLAGDGRNVDFVLVDGDHSSDGVRRDVEDLLESPAIARTVIVLHDTMNETVRAGLESVHYDAYPKVASVELDFVPGYMFREPALLHELWGGLGLLVVDSSRGAYFSSRARESRYYEAFELIREAREVVIRRAAGTGPEQQLDSVRDELAELREQLNSVYRSASWRMTAPLRAFGRALRPDR